MTNVARRKARLNWSAVGELIDEIGALCEVRPLTPRIHVEGRRIAERYQLGFHDALIAAALDAGASRLCSEDMQDGLVVDETLRIVDPFA